MVKVINFYLDESGSKCPDRNPQEQLPGHGHDFFAFGGVLLKDEDENQARQPYQHLCNKWNINYPLHSTDIRNCAKDFHWLNSDKNKRNKFLTDISNLVVQIPAIGIACTIDRPGYNYRYKDKYGSDRWNLCKTAFNIVVERAAKYANQEGYRLRVLPERCSKQDDNKLKRYYQDLKTSGMPFNQTNSSQYSPLTPQEFKNILYDFKPKYKSSPIVQIADLYLWPMAMGGYDKNNYPYKHLLKNNKLIDCLYNCEEVRYLGIKYSCFDLVHTK